VAAALKRTYCEAVRAALREALQSNLRAFLMGKNVAFAEAGPWEPAEDLLKDVYTL
jgi:hypothetical protein